MKGTAARDQSPEQDAANAAWLAASEKNCAENVMIVDMLRNDLGRIARTGSVHVPHLFELECYPTVWQMTSTVTARATCPSIASWMSLPCASITGAPAAMQVIAALRTPCRSHTGAIGHYAPGRRRSSMLPFALCAVDRFRGTGRARHRGGVVWIHRPWRV
jgi:para-aminobenzoate synthetase/4-amino-4-deoxychorismate lyase